MQDWFITNNKLFSSNSRFDLWNMSNNAITLSPWGSPYTDLPKSACFLFMQIHGLNQECIRAIIHSCLNQIYRPEDPCVMKNYKISWKPATADKLDSMSLFSNWQAKTDIFETAINHVLIFFYFWKSEMLKMCWIVPKPKCWLGWAWSGLVGLNRAQSGLVGKSCWRGGSICSIGSNLFI